MAVNVDEDPGYQRAVVVTYPTSPVSGGVCLYGKLAGIALTDERAAGDTTVDFGPYVVSISVTDNVTGGIAKGAPLFASETSPVVVSNTSSGVFFGYADEIVASGATSTIRVIHPPMIGGVLGAGVIGQTQITPGSLDGTVAKVVADAAVIGGIPVVHRIDLDAGAIGNTDVTLTHKTRVIDAYTVLRGAGVTSATLQVFNGASAITDAMDVSGSDKDIVRAASLDDAAWEIAAGGTLRITSATGATQPDATVYVTGIRVA